MTSEIGRTGLMGFLKAAFDATGGVLGDQWKDFYTVPAGLSSTAALFSAAPTGTNVGRGANLNGSANVISNGSKILVPEGYGLVLMQEGGITGFVAEAGAYEWQSDAPDSRSIFAGDGIVSTFISTSWERFKFGGRPQAQQQAFFVSLKELANNRFGTASAIYWDDAFLNTQVGATARGTYTIRITDPILFIKNLVPATYLQGGAVFDFTDDGNQVSQQLFQEVVGSLAQAFSVYANDPSQGNRMTRIQQDSVGFAQTLSEALERGYNWRTARGIEVVSTAIVGIEYDQATRELLGTVQRADALLGARGNSNMQASVAEGLQTAGAVDGAGGILGVAMAAGTAGVAGLHQPGDPVPAATSGPVSDADPVDQLRRFKQLLDEGLIDQADYDAAKAKALGL